MTPPMTTQLNEREQPGYVSNNGARMSGLADVSIHVPSADPARVQEAHILFGHMLCQWVELASCINHAVTNGGDEQ